MKGVPFGFSHDCLQVFETLKRKLTTTPIIVAPIWSLPFDLMCDASDFSLSVVLGQRRGKDFQVIYYASRTLNDHNNYTTIEKKLLIVIFSFDKF